MSKCYHGDMCGRMTIATEQELLEARFHAQATEKIEKRYNAYPNHDKYTLPVITLEDPELITLRYWGMVPVWWTRDTRGLINIKYETLRDKKTFRKDLAKRRCLVLADGFYEWKGERGHKTPYHIRLKSGEPFAFAGLYEENEIGGKPVATFAIITTEPNELMQPIHNRMPVILSKDMESAWLNPDMEPDHALKILDRSTPAGIMEAYEVSKKVNSPGFDQPELLNPIA
jgi:putative SOS response-associated peptidase YedK